NRGLSGSPECPYAPHNRRPREPSHDRQTFGRADPRPMSGAHVHVRPTRPDDLPELEDMWSEIQEGGGRLARALGRGDSGQRLAALARHGAGRLLVAEIDGEPVGM